MKRMLAMLVGFMLLTGSTAGCALSEDLPDAAVIAMVLEELDTTDPTYHTETYDDATLKKLVIDAEIGNVLIRPGTEDSFVISWNGRERVTCTTEGDTLTVDILAPEEVGNSYSSGKLIIDCPLSALNALDAHMNVGMISLYKLLVPRANVSVNAGAIYTIEVPGTFSAEVTVGLISTSHAFRDAISRNGVGQALREGKTDNAPAEGGDISLRVQTGNITID